MLIFSDAAAVRHGGAARRADFLDDLQSRIRMAGAVARAAQVVHNDLRPAPRQFESIGAAQSAAGAGPDDPAAVKIDRPDELPKQGPRRVANEKWPVLNRSASKATRG